MPTGQQQGGNEGLGNLGSRQPTKTNGSDAEGHGDSRTNGDVKKSLTPAQDNQVHSDNFKKWFGDWEKEPEKASKVVDEEGKPLVVYHHTNAKEFVNSKTGEKFDDLDWEDREYWMDEASQEEWDETWVEQDFNVFDSRYARRSVEVPGFFFAPKEFEDEGYGKRRVSVYLDIKNPIVDPDFRAMGFDRGSRDNVMADAMEYLQKQGYDGIINTEDGKPYEYIAFSPTQIKSATDNNGDFDGTNPDIRYSLTPAMNDIENKGISVNNKDVMDFYGLEKLTLQRDGKYLELSMVGAKEKGQGAGSRFMMDLISYADENNIPLSLTPSEKMGATSLSRLQKFYKRFGYKPNKGRTMDYTTRNSIIRQPQDTNVRFSRTIAEDITTPR